MKPSKNLINPFALSKRIGRPLILDGAMGSMLQHAGLKSEGSLWMSLANITHPDVVLSIHEKYIKAGADIITTNTFRTNPYSVEISGKRFTSEQLVKESVGLAINAAERYPVYIAGSNAPAEDCYQKVRTISNKKLKLNHHKHINLLFNNGCHFILNETQSHLDEVKIICEYCFKNELPYVLSLFVDENLNLLSGENVFEVVPFIMDYAPLALGFNCIRQNTFSKIYRRLSPGINWGTYLNCGSGEYSDDNITCGISPVDYKNVIQKILPKSPSFIGACCGSTPLHIKELKKIFNGKTGN